jgi:hypothetical protein
MNPMGKTPIIARALPARILGRAPSGEAAHRADEPEVQDSMRELGAEHGFEMGQEVQLAAVVGAVMLSAERDDAVGLVAAAQRAGNQVRRIDARRLAADDAPLALDLDALGGRGRG